MPPKDYRMRRNAVLDHARLWAAFGIVFFHTGAPGGTIGYAALPFFLMLLVVLMVPGARRMRPGEFIHSRAKRLLFPWLTWSAIYGVLKLLDAVKSAKPLATEFPSHVWLTGTALHLWFLPFAFIGCVALYPVVRLRPGVPGLVGLLAMSAFLALLLLGLHQNQNLPIPLPQWTLGGAAMLLAIGFALAEGQSARLMLALAVLLACLLAALAIGWQGSILQLGGAGGVLTLCLLWYRPETSLSQQAARLSLGVYLAHPMVSALLVRLTPLPQKGLALAICTIFGSLALAWLIDVKPWRKLSLFAATRKS